MQQFGPIETLFPTFICADAQEKIVLFPINVESPIEIPEFSPFESSTTLLSVTKSSPILICPGHLSVMVLPNIEPLPSFPIKLLKKNFLRTYPAAPGNGETKVEINSYLNSDNNENFPTLML